MFFNNMLTAFTQVLILAVIVLVGFVCDKTKLYTEKAARLTNDLLFYIITPCVIIDSFLSVKFDKQSGLGLLAALGCAVAFHIVAIGLSFLLFNKGDKDKNSIFKYATIYGNMGYMGLPLSKAVLDAVSPGAGEIGVFYCSTAVAAFNLFCFTHGVWLMDGGNKKSFNFKKLIINPGTLGILIGLPLFLLGVNLPKVILTPVESIASLNTPLAMIMFGTYLANTDLKSMFKQKEIYISSLVKLVILPIVMILAFRLCGVTGYLLITCAVFVSTPAANNTVMFAAKFNKDTGLASKTTALSSVLSIFTMPVCIALAMAL
jgi:putative permease